LLGRDHQTSGLMADILASDIREPPTAAPRRSTEPAAGSPSARRMTPRVIGNDRAMTLLARELTRSHTKGPRSLAARINGRIEHP